MKYISFVSANGPTYGVLQGESVVDLGTVFGPSVPDLKSLIGSGLMGDVPRRLSELKAIGKLEDFQLLPVIPNPGKIVCIGLNYHEHVAETGRAVTVAPTLFLRVPASQVAHGQEMLLPPESQELDYEGEIAIVIGKGGRRIQRDAAWQHVAGYSCYNDGSIRDWQSATPQWTAGKNFWRTGGFGPWMVSADEIPPGQSMTITTRLNGAVMQHATTDMMIHSIPDQIAYISTFTPLESGDVIVTGTPGGVGARRAPPLFMKPGDVVEIEVDAIGTLRNTVGAERT